jgi:hypothetical protein
VRRRRQSTCGVRHGPDLGLARSRSRGRHSGTSGPSLGFGLQPWFCGVAYSCRGHDGSLFGPGLHTPSLAMREDDLEHHRWVCRCVRELLIIAWKTSGGSWRILARRDARVWLWHHDGSATRRSLVARSLYPYGNDQSCRIPLLPPSPPHAAAVSSLCYSSR